MLTTSARFAGDHFETAQTVRLRRYNARMARGVKRIGQLLAATLLTLAGCGGPGPENWEDPDPPKLSPPDWTWQGPLTIPADLLDDVQYWEDAKWPSGEIPVNIAGEPLSRRRALLYYSLQKGPYSRPSTLVLRAVRGSMGAKDGQLNKLNKLIGFTVADSRYVNLHQQMTYWIWIEDFSYGSGQLAWVGDYILQNYQADFVCVQPMVRATPWGGGWHNGGGGGSW
jgi:hypothetical protein